MDPEWRQQRSVGWRAVGAAILGETFAVLCETTNADVAGSVRGVRGWTTDSLLLKKGFRKFTVSFELFFCDGTFVIQGCYQCTHSWQCGERRRDARRHFRACALRPSHERDNRGLVLSVFASGGAGLSLWTFVGTTRTISTGALQACACGFHDVRQNQKRTSSQTSCDILVQHTSTAAASSRSCAEHGDSCKFDFDTCVEKLRCTVQV